MTKLDFCKDWTYGGAPVTLPHDAMILAPRRPDAPCGSGGAYFEGGVYEYEKTFIPPAEWSGKTVLLRFEGVYRKARVHLNGSEIGGADYGYIPFDVELKDLNFGCENVIKVTADNSGQPNSRWYSGGGIFRPVWLCVCGALKPDCVKVTTLSYSPARVRVEVDCAGEPTIEILDGEGAVASGSGRELELDIPGAKLWSDETPNLYTCRVTVGDDTVETNFGIRKVEWSPKGLFVNGKETLLRGGCIHHDGGILGAAATPESEWRRVRIMKENGFNAIRSAHNPASPALIDACDHYGVYLMDELWDMWYSKKTKFDYSVDFPKNYRRDIETLVKRDYNHPSVIMYSIGNEVSEPGSEKGLTLEREMADALRSLDGTRAVTAGLNLAILLSSMKGNSLYNPDEGGRSDDSVNQTGAMDSTQFNQMTSMVGSGMNNAANSDEADSLTSPALDILDIAGYNYASGRYPLEGEKHPRRVVVGSETFPQDIAGNWAMVKKYPYLIGDFMWTAWDYIGEVGIGAWAYTDDAKVFDKPYPWLLADTGAIDILGVPNGEMFLAQAAWGLLKSPKIAVRPVNHDPASLIKSVWRGTNSMDSWSWQGCDGNPATVEVFTDAAEVELLINGRSVGRVPVEGCVATFETTYRSGRVEAIAYDAAGNEVGRSAMESAKSAEIHAAAERSVGGEVVYIPVTIGDGKSVESAADRKLTVTAEGCELMAFGSANPRTEERFNSGEYSTYYGRALAVVRVTGGAGKVTITDGEHTAVVAIPAK